MFRIFPASLALAFLAHALPSPAQTGDGSLRGYVKDDQGGVLPGVTVTAHSPALLAPVSRVSDAAGYYRLLNLPPGTYAVTAELAGFSTYRREGIIMRAGITFTVDVQMQIGTLAETVTVTGDSPMIETGRPTSVLNIDGELVRAAPITSRRLFSDALDLAPGVGSRNVDDGVGRRAYYFRGSHIYAHAFQLEGAPASAYIDSAAHSMGMGGDTVQDVEIKLGGADASTPLSTGVVMNVVTPRGQNQFKGSTSFSYQPLELEQRQHQRRRGAGRPADIPGGQPVGLVAGWPHHPGQSVVLRHLSLRRSEKRHQPHAAGSGVSHRVPARLRAVRQLLGQQAAVRQGHDAARASTSSRGSGSTTATASAATANATRTTSTPRGAGGSMYLVKLNSVWGNRLQTPFSASYNNKGGAEEDTYADFPGFGPVDQRASDAPASPAACRPAAASWSR